jgi:hypothetical protein
MIVRYSRQDASTICSYLYHILTVRSGYQLAYQTMKTIFMNIKQLLPSNMNQFDDRPILFKSHLMAPYVSKVKIGHDMLYSPITIHSLAIHYHLVKMNLTNSFLHIHTHHHSYHLSVTKTNFSTCVAKY